MARRHASLLTICCGALLGCASLSAAPATDFRSYKVQPGPDQALVLQWAERFEFATLNGKDGAILPYRILERSGPGPKPLVVVLHGGGAVGSDNRSQIGAFAAAWAQPGIPAAVIVVPQVAERSANYHIAADGQPASHAGPSLPLLLDLIDRLRLDPSVDPHRVHLVGYSMGASAAMQLALDRPGQFASITAFAPVPPDRKLAARLSLHPMTVIHGDQDTENPFAADVLWVEALRKAGGRPRFIVYNGMDHRVPPDMAVAVGWRQELVSQAAR